MPAGLSFHVPGERHGLAADAVNDGLGCIDSAAGRESIDELRARLTLRESLSLMLDLCFLTLSLTQLMLPQTLLFQSNRHNR